MAVNVEKKYHINLLQAELLPQRVLLTLPRVLGLWSLVLFVMLAWLTTVSYSQSQLTSQLASVQQENQQVTQQVETLTQQLDKRKVDSLLAEQLASIKILMLNKQALHASLTNPNQTYVAGFADAMQELSQMHSKNIRLQTIRMNNQQMTFSGLALTPEAVPAWLAGFEHSLLLSGKSFEHFKLSENEHNITEFMVSSKKTPEVTP